MKKYVLAGLVAGLVAALTAVGVVPFGAPGPKGEGAPATEFSAARALVDLRAIAAEPRPIGSAAATRVREHLRARLRELRIASHVQTSGVVSALNGRVAGTVHDVVARLPGRDPSRAVLLVAHYDSVPVGPGAADGGSGVVVLLETARALAAGPRPRNDVILLFTDGEERGLLGAQAFLRDDPWAYGVGVVLNVDSMGSSSPLLMYETSPGNGRLVRRYMAAVRRPFTTSLMYELSRRQPSRTDFRPFLGAGVPGLNLGALDGPAYYHTGYDTVANLNAWSLQHQGDTMLALARHLGELELWDLHRPDVVYFDVGGRFAVVYGEDLVLPFVGLAAALLAVALFAAARRRLLSLRGLGFAVPATAGVLGAALLVMAFAWGMYRTAYEERTWSETGVVISDLYRLGLVLLATAVTVALYMLLLRRLRVWDVAAAALLWWLGIAVGVSIALPGASYLLTWPLAGGALGLLAAVLVGQRATESWAGVLLAVAGAAPGLVLASSATSLLLLSAGLKQVATVGAVWLLSGLLVVPLEAVRRGFRLWLPAALAAAGFAVLFSVGSTVVYDTEHPRFTSIYYRLEASGAATWQSVDPVNDWTRQFLARSRRVPFTASYFPRMGMQQATVGVAPDAGLVPPRIEVLSDRTEGDRRSVRLRLSSPRGAEVLSLVVHSVVGSLTASVDGMPLQGRDTTILDGSTARWTFDYYAPPAQGIVVTLRCAAGPSLLLRAVDFSYGIPASVAGLYEARPAGVLAGRIGDGALAETLLRLPAAPAGP